MSYLVDIAALRRELGLSAAEDHRVLRLAEAVTALFTSETGRSWALETGRVEERMRRGARQRHLYLALLPVTALTKVEHRDAGDAGWTVLDTATDVVVSGPTGRLEYLGGCWRDRIRVTYSGGLDLSDPANVPPDIREACLVQALFMHERQRKDRIASRGVASKGGSVSLLERADLHPFFVRVVGGRRRRS